MRVTILTFAAMCVLSVPRVALAGDTEKVAVILLPLILWALGGDQSDDPAYTDGGLLVELSGDILVALLQESESDDWFNDDNPARLEYRARLDARFAELRVAIEADDEAELRRYFAVRGNDLLYEQIIDSGGERYLRKALKRIDKRLPALLERWLPAALGFLQTDRGGLTLKMSMLAGEPAQDVSDRQAATLAEMADSAMQDD